MKLKTKTDIRNTTLHANLVNLGRRQGGLRSSVVVLSLGPSPWRVLENKFCEIFESRYLEKNALFNTKFEGEFQVHKWTSWVVQHYKIIIQDGGSRHLEFLHKHQ